MGRISKNPDDYEPISRPEEPDVWFKVRPVSMADLKGLNSDAGEITVGLDLLPHLIVAWSYPDKPTPESVGELDVDTTLWLAQAIKSVSNIRENKERDFLGESSLPTSDPEAAPSLVNSDT